MPELVFEDPAPVSPSGRLYISPQRTAPAPAGDPWADFPDAEVPPSTRLTVRPGASGASAGTAAASAPGADPWADYPDADAPAKPPKHDYGGFKGGAQAAARGLAHGATLGLEPVVEGAQAAANPDIEAAARKFGIDPKTALDFINHLAPGLKALYGAGRLAYDKATAQDQTPAEEAYSNARADAAEADKGAYEQHPYLYEGGNLAGSIAAPVPGMGAVRVGAGLGERVARGVAEGMTAGGMFGAGNAIGQGKDAREVVGDAANGVATGALLGGAVGGLIGRRAATAPTAADRAAETAEQLGAPLPRGVASNSPVVRATTAKVKEVPFVGERIGGAVDRTVNAAGDAVEDMASNLAGGAATRTTAAPGARRAVQNMIEHNNSEIDAAYNQLRREINPDQHAPMPNLRRALQAIMLRRSRAGWQNPAEGLQQAMNVANGAGHAGGFNGVHRLRRDLREAGNPQKANPGYDAGDFRALRSAVDADLRNLVRHVATDPNRAESLFNTAELTASQLIQMNKVLEGLSGQKGESIVGALLNSAKEKSGNIALLREARRTMRPATFDQLSGVLLHELGLAEGQVGEFSLARFVTNWNKISDQAKAVMFSPQHRQQIENIVNLGEHLKDAGKFTNTSHTGSIVVLLDLAKDIVLLTRDIAQHGELGMGALAGMGSTAATLAFTYWLGNPKTAASMSRWTSAYRGLTLNQPTPARIAAFKVATRNLANNIHIPFDRIMEVVSNRLPVHANGPDKQQLGPDQGPRK